MVVVNEKPFGYSERKRRATSRRKNAQTGVEIGNIASAEILREPGDDPFAWTTQKGDVDDRPGAGANDHGEIQSVGEHLGDFFQRIVAVRVGDQDVFAFGSLETVFERGAGAAISLMLDQAHRQSAGDLTSSIFST